MKSQIAITDDLADIFMIQALKEDFCSYLSGKDKEARDKFAEYMIYQNKIDKTTYLEKFNRLSQLMLMYDKIEFPIRNYGFILHGKIKKMATIRQNLPQWFSSTDQLTKDELSDENAIKLKPIIMSAIKNINFSSEHILYAIKRAGSIQNLYSIIFDMMYNHISGVYDQQLYIDTCVGYSMLAENIVPEYASPEYNIIYANDIVTSLVKSVLMYFEINNTQEYDYYSKIFSNFSTETNLNAAYAIIL